MGNDESIIIVVSHTINKVMTNVILKESKINKRY
jgi:hypothetical protein